MSRSRSKGGEKKDVFIKSHLDSAYAQNDTWYALDTTRGHITNEKKRRLFTFNIAVRKQCGERERERRKRQHTNRIQQWNEAHLESRSLAKKFRKQIDFVCKCPTKFGKNINAHAHDVQKCCFYFGIVLEPVCWRYIRSSHNDYSLSCFNSHFWCLFRFFSFLCFEIDSCPLSFRCESPVNA